MAKIELLQDQSKIRNFLQEDEKIIWQGKANPSFSISRSNSSIGSVIVGGLCLFIGITLFQKTSPDEIEFYYICYGLFSFSALTILYPFLSSYYSSKKTKYYLTNFRFFKVKGYKVIPLQLNVLKDIHIVNKNGKTGTVLAGEYTYETSKREDFITERYEHKGYFIVIRKLTNPEELVQLVKANIK